MALIKLIKKPAEQVLKKGLDKIFKRTIEGKKGSPFKNVDDLGVFPVHRSKIQKRNKASEKLFDQSGKIRGGLRMGGRASYKHGSMCKLATKGKGRAYGKNS